MLQLLIIVHLPLIILRLIILPRMVAPMVDLTVDLMADPMVERRVAMGMGVEMEVMVAAAEKNVAATFPANTTMIVRW
jgi:hypothetical protein